MFVKFENYINLLKRKNLIHSQDYVQLLQREKYYFMKQKSYTTSTFFSNANYQCK